MKQQQFPSLLIINHVFEQENQNIRMISEESCINEDWSKLRFTSEE